jgi:Domain of unknown function (DUF4424)
MKKIMQLAAIAAIISFAAPVTANDSSSAIGIGGLQLTQNNAVSMDSEDLFLSVDKIVVKYHFTNTTSKNVETLVSFPLPSIPTGIQGYLGDQSYPSWSEFEFKTLVEGKPVSFEKIDKIEAGGRDVSARLKELGWQVSYWTYEDDNFFGDLQKLGKTEKAAFVKEGLLKWRDDKKEYVDPNWQVTTHITRKQIFPAGKTISVEHSYKPLSGGSVGGSLERSQRKDESFPQYAGYYCMDKAFLRGFDKQRYTGKKDEDGNEVGSMYVETWLDYVLKSGANWKGPIKNFRLVVDKGAAKNLLSMCMTGVKKISPTQFEVVKKNFEPTKDINILIVRFAPLD